MTEWSLTLGHTKTELVLSPPLLAASGAMGYGRESGPLLRSGAYGAWVTPPITWDARPGSRPPRLAETTAGYLLRTGRRNPGLPRVSRRQGGFWRRLGLPVILALYGRSTQEIDRMADYVASRQESGELDAVEAIELHLPHDVEPALAEDMIECVVELVGIPCLVRAPFENTIEIARIAQDLGADGVVVAAPPMARAPADDGTWLYGPLYGPALSPLYMERVHQVASAVEIAVIARGGIANLDDMMGALACGAVAVQLDSILYVQPNAGRDILAALEAEMSRRGAVTWEDVLATCRTATL